MRANIIAKSFILLSVTLFFSCKNSNSELKQSAPEIKMVNVPAVISDPAQINSYVADHFWDGVDFGDSLLLLDKQALNRHYSIYLDHIQQCPRNVAEKSVKKFVSALLKGSSPVREYLVNLTEKVLYDPNSQHRNEDIYIWVLEIFTNDSLFPEYDLERFRNQLVMSLKNRPGEIATDFTFITTKGKESTLHNTKGEFTLLFFYDPDCHSCEYSLEYIKESAVIESFKSRITKLAIYTGNDADKWMGSSKKFSPEWIVGYNNDFSIERGQLYDRRATPYIFLLNKEKRVLVKDATPADIEYYLQNLI